MKTAIVNLGVFYNLSQMFTDLFTGVNFLNCIPDGVFISAQQKSIFQCAEVSVSKPWSLMGLLITQMK